MLVLITTKKTNNKITEFDFNEMDDEMPMVIIDSEKSDRQALNKLSPNDIESINVVKGEQAMKKYKAANGVIIVITKKGKKN